MLASVKQLGRPTAVVRHRLFLAGREQPMSAKRGNFFRCVKCQLRGWGSAPLASCGSRTRPSDSPNHLLERASGSAQSLGLLHEVVSMPGVPLGPTFLRRLRLGITGRTTPCK